MKRHTLTDNAISFLIGAIISIPIIVTAYKDKEVESVPAFKSKTVVTPVEEVETTPTISIYDLLENSDPCIDEAYSDREYLGEFKITAYCACEKCCGKSADGITATGTIATEGRTIAVDPKVIPYGSIVEIDGIDYIAEDCGGAIKENRIDIFFESHQVALEWGVQYHDVYMVEEAID